MYTGLNKHSQAALEKLAELFDIDSDHLESLLARGEHPLPPPPPARPYDHCIFPREYLEHLNEWVQRELRNPRSTQWRDLNPSLVQQKLRKIMTNLTDNDFVQSFPSGYFLG